MRGTASRSTRSAIGKIIFLLAFYAAACGHKAAIVKPPAPPPATLPKKPNPPPREETPPPPVVPPSKTTVAVGGSKRAPAPPAVSTGVSQRGPLIRVGLSVAAEELRISAGGEFYLIEKSPEAPRRILTGQVQVRLERPLSEAGEIFRVQVASLANQEAAEKLGRQLSDQLSVPAVVQENATTGTNQVRLGRFATRKEAQEFVAGAIAEAGYRDAFIVREVGKTAKGEPTLALRGPENFFRISRTGYLFLPAADGSFLRLNGKPYRGTLDLTLKDGRVIVANELGMEEYLLGVVPSELSPVSYPEVEAQAAQAIAARTYALKNMGKFRADGYDLTDDARTQVYGGVTAEKEGSSEAVRETFGMAIYYNGTLIDAMYTSTCGGRTEDFANVFDTPPVPYLKSVTCTAESASAELQGASVKGNHDLSQVHYADDGSPANRELELAQVLSLAGSDPLTPESLAGVPSAGEIKGWIDRTRLLAGKTDGEGGTQASDITSRAGFIRYAAERFFGAREIERRISESDASYYVSNFSDGASIPAPARRAIAYLVQRKLWQPYPDNSVRPDQSIRRGDALALLVRWIMSTRPEILKTGVSTEPSIEVGSEENKNVLSVKRGSRTERLRLAPGLRLFKMNGGRSVPVAQMRIIGNERLTFHQQPNGEIDFLEVELSATGAASDRFSPSASWQVTITRAMVAEKLRSVEKLRALLANAGEIRDLKPARLGNSGRVVQLEIIGSRGSVVLNGYQVRNALGLRDTLYTLSRMTVDDGSVASFTFDGRGWGHGVGLCQTGAVGMARAGRSAEEILKTYYQGVEVRKAY